jgi:hypothetical protein
MLSMFSRATKPQKVPKSPNTLHKDAQSQSDDVRCPFQETINKLNKTKGPKDTKSKALL